MEETYKTWHQTIRTTAGNNYTEKRHSKKTREGLTLNKVVNTEEAIFIRFGSHVFSLKTVN